MIGIFYLIFLFSLIQVSPLLLYDNSSKAKKEIILQYQFTSIPRKKPANAQLMTETALKQKYLVTETVSNRDIRHTKLHDASSHPENHQQRKQLDECKHMLPLSGG